MSTLASAQDVNTDVNGATDKGLPANGIFHGSDFDNVQINNGNLHIEIPVVTLKGRGDTVTYKYVYNSKGWEFDLFTDLPPNIHRGFITGELNNTLQFTLLGGDSFGYTVSYKTNDQVQCANNQGAPIYGTSYSGYTLVEPDGTKHPFPGTYGPVGAQCPAGSVPPVVYSSDGSGWILHIGFAQSGNVPLDLFPKNAVRKDGTTINFDNGGFGAQVNVVDRNGNILTQATDTLDRATPQENFNSATGKYEIAFFDANGNQQKIQITKISVPVHTGLCGFQTVACQEDMNDALSQPSVIELPNGQQYQFQYAQNQYAQPTSVTLPTGAQISWGWGSPDTGGPKVTSRTVTVGGSSFPWQYNYGFTSGATQWVNSIIDPLGKQTDFTCQYLHVGYAAATSPNERGCTVIKTQQYQGAASPANLVQTVDTQYLTTGAVLPTVVTTTWSQQNLVSKVETDWDSITASVPGTGNIFRWGNPIEKREFSYGTGAPGAMVRRTHYDYLHLNNQTYQNLNLADLVTSEAVYDGAGNLLSSTQDFYDDAGNNPWNVPYLQGDLGNASSHDSNFGTANLLRGNATRTQHWLNTNNSWLVTYRSYDDLGNLVSTRDPNNRLTSFSYGDRWSNNGCVPAGVNTQAFVTQVTNALGHNSQTAYYPCTGAVQAQQDQNDINAGRTGITFAYDLMGRFLTINKPDGGQTSFCYSEISGASCYNGGSPLKVVTTKKINTSLSLISTVVLDGLGRTAQTQVNSDPQGVDYVDFTYDAIGRKKTVSNPHRSATSSTDGITTYQYDALNRVTQVAPPDGTDPGSGAACLANNLCTSYSGNTTTVTDQAGKQRRSLTDALGRLTQVFEDPAGLNYETDYQYDGLNNLLRVDQKGSAPSDAAQWRTRTFTYDSLSRLQTASNPESGMMTYFYDNVGNLLQKVLPVANRPGTDLHTLSYCYDELDRVTGIAYSWQNCQNGQLPAGTAEFTYTYDTYAGAAQGSSIGRLVRSGRVGYLGHYFWYDPMGRVTSTWQCLPSDCSSGASVSVQYDFLGNLTQLTYPNNEVVSYTPDAAGRAVEAIDTASNIKYLTSATYGPDSSLTGFINGKTSSFTGIASTFVYNKRLQPCRIAVSNATPVAADCLAGWGNVLDLGYDFHLGNGDNGNVWGITRWGDQSRNQSFTYDALNRLTSAQNNGTDCSVTLPDGHTKFWGNSYNYDAWGNLLQKTPTKCAAENLNAPATVKNQLLSSMNCFDASGKLITTATYCYGAAGNLLTDGSGRIYTYDAENRITGFAGSTYTYDAEGDRLRKDTPAGSTEYVNFGGSILAEKNVSTGAWTNYVFFNGNRVARRDPNGSVFYYFSDHLKTAAVITDSAGIIQNESDYYPWGGELQITNTVENHYKFTSKERDAETQLDYMGARYYSNGLGRFISADWSAKPVPVPYAIFGDPQTLNQYSYVRNNPIARADLDGHGWWSDFKEKIVNGWKYGEAVTNSNLPAAFAKERQWLINNARNAGGGALTPSQVNGLQGASNQQINGLYKGYENALIIKQQLSLCECAMSTNPQDYQRAGDGSLVPLTKLHGDETIVRGNSASYDYWKGQSTEAIIDSLKAGSKFGELTVKPNGVVMDGNTRVKVLEERGVNVNTLERIILETPKEPIP